MVVALSSVKTCSLVCNLYVSMYIDGAIANFYDLAAQLFIKYVSLMLCISMCVICKLAMECS